MNPLGKVLPVWALLVVVTAARSSFSWNTALSCVLTIAVLVTVIRVTRASNWFLVWMTFALYFGISWVNTSIEAVLFQVLPLNIAFQSCALGVTTAFTISVLLCLRMDRFDVPASGPQGVASQALVGKLAVGACVYFVLYLLAGIMIHPFIKDFYAHRWLPSMGQLVGIQFARGLLYIALALPFLLSMRGHRVRAAMTLGLCFSVLGGLAPLLLSNTYMPVPVRMAHAFEVGISNFIYGVVIAYLLVPREATPQARWEAASALPNQD